MTSPVVLPDAMDCDDGSRRYGQSTGPYDET